MTLLASQVYFINPNSLFTYALFAPELKPQLGEAERSGLRPPASVPAAMSRRESNSLLGQPRRGAQHSLPKSFHLNKIFPKQEGLEYWTTKKGKNSTIVSVSCN